MDEIKTNSQTDSDGMIKSVSVEIDQEQIARVNSLLQSAPQKAMTVYKRAIGRALKAGRTQANKEIRERYDIPLASLRDEHTYNTYHEKIQEDGGAVIGYINFAGSKIPLYRFHPNPKTRQYTTRYVNGRGGWRVTTDVSAADVKGQMIRRRTAFIATFPSGHTGIFYRTGDETYSGTYNKELNIQHKPVGTGVKKPHIHELWGFSVKDMLDYPEARENIQNRMAEIIEKRIEHELSRALE